MQILQMGLAFGLWIIEIGNLGNLNDGCSDDKRFEVIKGNVEVRKSLPYLIENVKICYYFQIPKTTVYFFL